MEVKRILKLSASMLQLHDIEDIVDRVEMLEDVDNVDLKLLLNCVNLINDTIATDYINLKETLNITNISGRLKYKDLTDKHIYKIISVKDAFDNGLAFKADMNGITCPTGDIKITYSYFPKTVGFNDEINCYGCSLTERVFAFGVVSEYLFIKFNYDDAAIWDDRFKNAMKNIVRHRKEIIMPKRRWW